MKNYEKQGNKSGQGKDKNVTDVFAGGKIF